MTSAAFRQLSRRFLARSGICCSRIRVIGAVGQGPFGTAERRETHEIPRYAYELASAFSQFYRDCKVLGDDAALSGARLALVDATRSVLANALDLLGISAPEAM